MTQTHATELPDDEWEDEAEIAEESDEDFEDAEEDDDSGLSELGHAAEALRKVLEQETALARNGGLAAFAEAIRDKRAALATFTDAKTRAQTAPEPPTEADCAALHRLVATADENALVLDAVRSTIDDLSARLRKALTASSDPGTYGPTDRRPRHAVAARLDTRI